MTNTPTLLSISEPLYCTLLISWVVMVLLAAVAGYFIGRHDEACYEARYEAKRRILEP